MERTEDGELEGHRFTFDQIIPETTNALTISDIKFSPILTSLFASLRGKVLICQHRYTEDYCKQCDDREDHIQRMETQIKAEMIAGIEAKAKIKRYQEDNIILRTWIDLNEGRGESDKIIRQSKMGVVK